MIIFEDGAKAYKLVKKKLDEEQIKEAIYQIWIVPSQEEFELIFTCERRFKDNGTAPRYIIKGFRKKTLWIKKKLNAQISLCVILYQH